MEPFHETNTPAAPGTKIAVQSTVEVTPVEVHTPPYTSSSIISADQAHAGPHSSQIEPIVPGHPPETTSFYGRGPGG